MTKHEKKRLQALAAEWRRNARAGRKLEKTLRSDGFPMGAAMTKSMSDMATQHAAQLAHILRRAR